MRCKQQLGQENTNGYSNVVKAWHPFLQRWLTRVKRQPWLAPLKLERED